jgi:type I restriction enzyme S subunit
MSACWPTRTIEECAADEPYATQIGPFGKALTPEAYRQSGVPLLRGVNVNHGRFHDDDYVFIGDADADRLAKFESFPGDVLLVHKGTLGQIGLMPADRRFDRYIMGNSMLRVRCNPKVLLSEYLYYWLSSSHGKHYLLSRVSQVGVPQIQRPLTTLREASFPVPPVPEQRAIVGVLGALDDKIEQNRRTAEGLEKFARAIFRAWFVDFEPVHAKAAGATSFPGMPPAVFHSLPTRLVDSELGPIPEGWGVEALRGLCDLSKEQIKPLNHPDELFDHFSLPAFDASRRPVAEPGFGIKSSKFAVPANCVLISKLNPRIPRIWLPGASTSNRQIASTEFLVLQPKAGVSRERIYCQVGQTTFLEVLTQTATGTSNSHQRVKPQDFMATPVIKPSAAACSAFDHQVIPMMDRIRQMSDESRKLGELRDYLLPKLLSGEVRVKGAADEEAA